MLTLLVVALVAYPVFAKPPKIGVFIPGVREGSPTYDQMAKGVEKLVSEIPGSSVKIFEAGFNQADWQEQLTNLVATGNYDFIVTSNPSMPDLINKISPMFPKQKFICFDGISSGNPNLYTVLYNQLEQGYITGYLAGLETEYMAKGKDTGKKIGMIIGQHYPAMDKLIIPGFQQGAEAADPAFQLDIRVLGNWYDATKAAELAKSMFASGIEVILPICGSASEGVIKTAIGAGKHLVFFDSDEYSRAPMTIIGCTALNQEALAYNKVKSAIEGTLPFGKADIVGMKEGYIEFLGKNQSFLQGVPSDIRAKVENAIAKIKSGALAFKVPDLSGGAQ
jgi:simple sugar transport system substrate-binding protein